MDPIIAIVLNLGKEFALLDLNKPFCNSNHYGYVTSTIDSQ